MDLMPLAYTLTGIGVYLQQLITAIQHCSSDVDVGFASHCEIPFPGLIRKLFTRNLDAELVRKLRVQLKLGCSPFGPLRKYSATTLKCGFDLYHITNSVSLYKHYSVPTVVTVYDLAELRDDAKSTKYDSLIPAIRDAQSVICISETTQRDVVELLGVPQQKTIVTPLAPRALFQPPVDAAQRAACRLELNRGVPYLLAVSTIEPRKNYVRMLQAFAQVRARGQQLDFVIAGAKRSAWPEVSATIERLGLQGCVHVLGWVDNQRLLKLMWGSEALAYASLYEGFGLPVVEAMATGTPVIASNVGSIPEVVGDAFPLVDPLSVDNISQRMQQIMNNAGGVDRLGLMQRAQRFSWDRLAERTVEVYRTVLNA